MQTSFKIFKSIENQTSTEALPKKPVPQFQAEGLPPQNVPWSEWHKAHIHSRSMEMDKNKCESKQVDLNNNNNNNNNNTVINAPLGPVSV